MLIPVSTLSVIKYLDLWQQLGLASELESYLRETVDWVRKSLVNFNAKKTELISSSRSNYTGLSISMLKKLNLFRLAGLIVLACQFQC